MKKVLLLVLTAMIMAGCGETVETNKTLPVEYTTREGMRVNIIDSCEYIRYSSGFGPEYVHKGNCKYCAQRDSIKWEKRKQELIKVKR